MDNKNSILFIWSNNYPFEIRLKKEMQSLLEKGYDIHILANNYNNLKEYENTENIHVHRIKYKNLKLLNTPFVLNPIWYINISNSIKNILPNLIIVRDLPLAVPVLLLSKLYKIKTIVDIAEHFPALMRENQKWSRNKFLATFWYKLYAMIEKYTVCNAENIIVVTEEQQQRMMNQYKVKKNKFSIINNTPKLSKEHNFEYSVNMDNPLTVVYTGQIDANFRGIETLLEAAKLVQNNNIIIKILGGGINEDKHREFIKDNKINNVIISGYMPHDKLMEEIKTSDIGIIPHTNSDVIQYTMPNKIFDYMLQSKPVIASNARPLKRIVKETNCGYVFEAENSESLSEVLLYINNNKGELYAKAQNGFNAIKNKYNWENDSKVLLNLVGNLLDKEEGI